MKLNTQFTVAIYFTFIFQTLAFAGSTPPNSSPKEHSFFHVFSGSITNEIKQIKKQNKTGAVLFFSTQHCRFCKRMKATVFNQTSVQAYFRANFRILELDIESNANLVDELGQTTAYLDYAKNHRVRLTPTIVFLNPAGEVAYRHVGMIADPQEFLWLGEYVVKGQTRKQSFASFKMNKRRQAATP